ncbi:hypothetical protein [Jeongeupia sp. HS-3]|uniref:BufA2 family periplasmic bufferin-type metallophore n=1 Tax=Jeongeupia sp. HS-3 TaxID=1009682 RepID=UPI0019110695|nr:hypothetical protein [Jeongeupia sp. HS-3]
MNRINGATLAAAAAAVFASAAVPQAVAAANMPEVKCAGINSCKGTSSCKTADNSCKGQNACKGHGWLPTATTQECTDKGGKVL